jgi:hypothetical protein
MRFVFISYHRESLNLANTIKERIESVGINVWMDVKLQAGENWRAEIEQAITRSICVIVIMSPKARLSEFVTYEWAYALGSGLTVIPILSEATQLHPRLELLQYLDFSDPERGPWEQLIKVVNGLNKPPRTDAPYDDSPNQIDGVSDKGLAFKERVNYALQDLQQFAFKNRQFHYEPNVGASYPASHRRFRRASIDFIVDLVGSKVLGINVYYSRQQTLIMEEAREIKDRFYAIRPFDNFTCFLLITNTAVKEESLEILKSVEPSIDVMDSVITPEYIVSKLESYIDICVSKSKGEY